MIEVLSDMPAGVVGIRVSGRIEKADLLGFKPTMDDMLDTDEIRFVEVIADDYSGFGSGALLEDFKLGFGSMFRHRKSFRRVAVVTDKEWMVHTVHALSWLVPGEVKLFGLDDLEYAEQWVAG